MTRLSKQGFWEWAYDSLFTNTTRGVLAEYIVATALGICDTKRVEWNQYDLEIDGAESEGAGNHGAEFEGAETDGAQAEKKRVGIEVKSAAYVQAWEQARLSEIRFGIRPAVGWDASTNTYADSARRSAAVYVFCVLEGEDKKSIDPLDVSLWTFYVVPTSVLDREARTRKTIGLQRLMQLAGGPCTCDELNAAIRQAAAGDRRSG